MAGGMLKVVRRFASCKSIHSNTGPSPLRHTRRRVVDGSKTASNSSYSDWIGQVFPGEYRVFKPFAIY